MMKNDGYRALMEQLHAPAGLKAQVLQAAQRQETAKAGLRHPIRRRRPLLRAAVCAACALALVVGTVHLTPRSGEAAAPGGSPALPQLTYSFGLTAYAADTGATLSPNANGGLALLSGSSAYDPSRGDFTGCLFRVTGEDIQTVALSVDQGGLYRCETQKGLTAEEVRALLKAEEEGTLDNGALLGGIYGDSEDAPMCADILTCLGSTVSEPYDPAAAYGFWVPPEELPAATDDLRQDAWSAIDTFDGARLTVSVTFRDGSTLSKTYVLSTGRLRTAARTDDTWQVLPQLAGDDEPYVYGIYAVSEAESRWLQWPVQGSTTISLSDPFGDQWTPGGQSKTTHSGIDIPAAAGTEVLAALDGTVAEVGFDTQLGNYLVLDHGGGLTTLYGACRSVDMEKGDTVRAGSAIASVGSTGMSTGSHLHFEVRQDGVAQDPVAYFDAPLRATLQMG